MEDFHDAQFTNHKNGEIVGFFSVYDGHGGPGCARFVKEHLLNNLLEHPKFSSDLKSAIGIYPCRSLVLSRFAEGAYEYTDKKYLNTTASYRDDGQASLCFLGYYIARTRRCTAVSAIVVDRLLVIANVGDSRAVLCDGGKAVQLSIDHKPNLFSEKERIESVGGMVVWAGTWRVGGILAVSRAFGDRPLKKYVIATPHTTVIEELNESHEFIVLATDGVWDVMTNEEVVQMVREEQDTQKAASTLTSTAVTRGSTDNISCIVVRFKFQS